MLYQLENFSVCRYILYEQISSLTFININFKTTNNINLAILILTLQANNYINFYHKINIYAEDDEAISYELIITTRKDTETSSNMAK